MQARILSALLASFAALLATRPATAAPRTHTVVIDKMKFGAMPAGVKAGDSIVWINRDMFRHTATAKGVFNIDLQPGEKGRTMVGKAGALPVTCKYHPGMRAVLRVEAR